MPATNRSQLCSFDADRVRQVVRNTVSGPLYAFCEYDTESFRPLYIADETIAMYESKDAMLEHFERIHTNVHMDFMQIELFRNTLFPDADRVEYIATAMDFLKILRVYVGDDGLFISVEPDEPVEPIVDAIKETVAWPENQNS
ncbi:hypothetical protein HTZ84_02485 [Haloterrigena sp. SYSU A558-1]|uniref:Uncharacterized protein n=1 Tax=Haloterrigena gelatinilytica TaxID=2741724 RepID=A0A8J8GSZ1_9EURY|nr:hypothetical protein [Haloterrigena gelatinilytica]NUB92900.1 hypothetical protein [Haloterrigena gelatinilytica]NUC71188.1 hypothetical protein [Haloterrigena gelatinilytica]